MRVHMTGHIKVHISLELCVQLTRKQGVTFGISKQLISKAIQYHIIPWLSAISSSSLSPTKWCSMHHSRWYNVSSMLL